MIEVVAELGKNLLIVRLEGFITDSEMLTISEKITTESKKLKKDFIVVTDVSKFKPESAEGASCISKAQKYLIEYGAGRFIRVIENALGRLQFNKYFKSVGVEIIEVTSMDEAKEYY